MLLSLSSQITLAVMVSGWAHVLHAMFKPWGAGSIMYRLQHGSLFVTTFVFLMVSLCARGCVNRVGVTTGVFLVVVQGLLYKVDGIAAASPSYTALSVVMVATSCGFICTWAYVVLLGVFGNCRKLQQQRKEGAESTIRSGSGKRVAANSTSGDTMTVSRVGGNAALPASSSASAGGGASARTRRTMQILRSRRQGPALGAADHGSDDTSFVPSLDDGGGARVRLAGVSGSEKQQAPRDGAPWATQNPLFAATPAPSQDSDRQRDSESASDTVTVPLAVVPVVPVVLPRVTTATSNWD